MVGEYSQQTGPDHPRNADQGGTEKGVGEKRASGRTDTHTHREMERQREHGKMETEEDKGE